MLMHMYVLTYMFLNSIKSKCTNIFTYIHTYIMHTHVHTNTYTHTCTLARARALSSSQSLTDTHPPTHTTHTHQLLGRNGWGCLKRTLLHGIGGNVSTCSALPRIFTSGCPRFIYSYTYMYICMYVCIPIYMKMYIYTYVYICIYVHICIHTYIYEYMYMKCLIAPYTPFDVVTYTHTYEY